MYIRQYVYRWQSNPHLSVTQRLCASLDVLNFLHSELYQRGWLPTLPAWLSSNMYQRCYWDCLMTQAWLILEAACIHYTVSPQASCGYPELAFTSVVNHRWISPSFLRRVLHLIFFRRFLITSDSLIHYQSGVVDKLHVCLSMSNVRHPVVQFSKNTLVSKVKHSVVSRNVPFCGYAAQPSVMEDEEVGEEERTGGWAWQMGLVSESLTGSC